MTTPSTIAESMLARERDSLDLAEFDREIEESKGHIYTHAERVPLAKLNDWYEEPDSGWLRHRSGKFFSIEGLRFSLPEAPVSAWCQPIINQPETGILGILVKEIDGIVHCLMQLKDEPGNCNGVQLSPTVQATRSNFTGVHGGRSVPYLEYFREVRTDQVLADVRQSEQGAWFLRKRNRNMIVSTMDEIPSRDGFRWLSVGHVLWLLRQPDLVNMDSRTVLSVLPFAVDAGRRGSAAADPFTSALVSSCDATAWTRHADREIQSWISEGRSKNDATVEPVPMDALTRWRRSAESIQHDTGQFFEVIGVRVESAGREVGQWTQPMLATKEDGLIGLLVTTIDGVLHVLMNLRAEPGLVDVAELAPTVQCTPGNYEHLPPAARPVFLEEFLTAKPEAIRFDSVLSDEGGRFYRVRNRHLIVETDTVYQHPDYRWMAVHQLRDLLRHSHYLNVQARSILVCLYSLLVDRA